MHPEVTVSILFKSVFTVASTKKNSAPAVKIFVKFYLVGGFTEIVSTKCKFGESRTKITNALHEGLHILQSFCYQLFHYFRYCSVRIVMDTRRVIKENKRSSRNSQSCSRLGIPG